MDISNFNKLMGIVKSNLWYPVFVVYGTFSDELETAKKLLTAAGIEYKERKSCTSDIGEGSMNVPGGGSVDPNVLPELKELALFVKGKDLKRSKLLLAKLQKPPSRDWRYWTRVFGGVLFFVGLVSAPVIQFADLLIGLAVLVFLCSYIGRDSRHELRKYTFVRCSMCERINRVELDKVNKAICSQCKLKLKKGTGF